MNFNAVSVARQITKFRLLAMMLLAENPVLGEQSARPSKAIDEVMQKGGGVIRYQIPGEMDAYVVVKDGVRYTTFKRPDGFDEHDMLNEKPLEYKETLVENQLQTVASELQAVVPEIYAQLGLRLSLETIKALRSNWTYSETISLRIIESELHRHPNLENSAQAASEYSISCMNRVALEFQQLKQAGDAARIDTATFAFFSVHPTPDLLYMVGVDHGLIHATILTQKERESVVQQVPIRDIKFYLSNPKSAGVVSSIAAKGAGRFLRRSGSKVLRLAKSKFGIASFYEDLYSALLSYRSAQSIYEDLLVLGDTSPSLWQDLGLNREEVHRFWVETEEIRVAILVSLQYAAISSNRGPNPMIPSEFFKYWEHLLNRTGVDKTELAIRDLAVRLVCPEFLCDLTICWLALQTGDISNRQSRRLIRVLDQMEADLNENPFFLSEPNYITPGYTLLTELLHQLGRSEEADQFTFKTNPEYYARIISTIRR
ncbi:MAG: hypothetical protein WA949_00565 [Phormidesmis sp.]